MVFQFCKTATSVSTKVSYSSREFSLKLSSGNGQEYITDTSVRRFQLSKMTMQLQEEKSYTVEVSPRQTAGLPTASLLASSASYFLIFWQKPCRFFATTSFLIVKLLSLTVCSWSFKVVCPFCDCCIRMIL